MPIAAAAGAGSALSAIGGIAGAAIGADATGKAAQAQAEASRYATDLQNQQFQQQQANQAPWLKAGQGALPQLSAMAASPVNFTQQDFLNNQDPAYQFDLQQGQQALERSAAARGGLQSGGTLKDLTSYAQGAASNEYSNAYNRFMTNQNTQFNRLASVAGIGQTANSQLNAAGMNAATNIGNIATGNANAQGAASIAQGNLWGGAVSGIGSGLGNNLMGYSYLSQLGKGAAPAAAAPTNVAWTGPDSAGGGNSALFG